MKKEKFNDSRGRQCEDGFEIKGLKVNCSLLKIDLVRKSKT